MNPNAIGTVFGCESGNCDMNAAFATAKLELRTEAMAIACLCIIGCFFCFVGIQKLK
jgi:hypothetical protein